MHMNLKNYLMKRPKFMSQKMFLS